MVGRQSLKLLFPLKGLSWFESKRGCGIESLIFEPLPFRGDAIFTKMAENYLFPLLKFYLIMVGEIMTEIMYKNYFKENENEKCSALRKPHRAACRKRPRWQLSSHPEGKAPSASD